MGFNRILEKHKDERDVYQFDWQDKIPTGDAIDSVLATVITYDDGDGTEANATTEFSPITIKTGAMTTETTLNAATQADHQVGSRRYRIYVRVSTTSGRTLTAVHKLWVSDEGVPAA